MKAIKAIYNLLSTNESINVQVYPTRVLEKNSFPAITLTQISRVGNDTKKEYSKSDIARIQINSIAYTSSEAFDISVLVRNAMSADVPNVFNNVLVQNIQFADEQIFMSDNFGLEGATTVAQDYLVMFSNEDLSIGSMLKEDNDLLLLESNDEILL
jgi:hypothetical protein